MKTKSSRSAFNFGEIPSSKKQSQAKFPHEEDEEFETESSVHEYYAKEKTKDEVQKRKIDQMQKKIAIIILNNSLEISKSRVNIDILKKKYLQVMMRQKQSSIAQKNAIQQMQAMGNYLLSKLHEQHEYYLQQIKFVYECSLEELMQQLQKEGKKRQQLLIQIQKTKKQKKYSKEQLKRWVKQNFQSNQKIQIFQKKILVFHDTFLKSIEDLKIQRQKEQFTAKQELKQVERLLSQYIQQQRSNRERNKQQILQSFQRLFNYKHFDLL